MAAETLELEKQVLSGLLKQDEVGDFIYNEAGIFLSEEDFSPKTREFHGPIITLIKQFRDKGTRPNPVIIAERLKELGVTIKSDISLLQYMRSLELMRVTQESAIDSIKELKKFAFARKILVAAKKITEQITANVASCDAQELLTLADKTYHDTIGSLFSETDTSVNIYGEMERLVEERGNNPLLDNGMVMDGWKYLHGMYGSLWKPANITVICARSGVGKTTIALDWNAKISAKYQIPVIHLDNGEMDHEELIFRSAAAESGVPMHPIETGKWRMNAQFTKMVRDTMLKLKTSGKMPIIHYIDIGGKSVVEIINCARREYFSKVGRGNPCILSFDYIKTSFEGGDKQEYQVVGEMVDRFKQFIKTEMCFNKRPVMSMLTSVQQNRYGEGDGAISLSDRIKSFCSTLFLLEKKSAECLMEEPVIAGRSFGTHRLLNLKCRHLGEMVERATIPVKMLDGTLRDNCIHLNIKNFLSEECGDLYAMSEYAKGNNNPV